ncbi:hypothetical protein CANCADRAFT_780 [Tortispora caseinolytica NRRL Y-17796]|uniref:Glutamyl-tRNA(Gln) amidotransferase subunit A, mitochondrial n=1 Tax=Tortispora caseinolytica NRRL Y-17796 TaxID=767744 RepID=A0A1E4TKC0_9ASCO|nr:hypothetical protein CANCADRAFT_780 [Tortispora caseinolytica NRRL Y-17796]
MGLTDHICKTVDLNKRLNALTSISKTFVSANISGPLANKYVVIKDNICTSDLPTTCASNSLRDYISPYEATCVTLLKRAGAIVIGKANLDEFGMGSTNTNTAFGHVVNSAYSPQSPPRTAGGSSGGSAVAAASGMCDFALGTDTGGSVRLPAAYCGTIGFKPTYGLISRVGVIAYAQSLDTVGILSNDLETVTNVFKVLNQYDPKDPTSLTSDIRRKAEDYKPPRKLRIGLPLECNPSDISPIVRQKWTEILQAMHNDGHKIYQVSIPTIPAALSTYYCISTAECSSNLSRFDGIRYGYRDVDEPDVASYEDANLWYAATRLKGFGDEVRRRVLLGTYSLSAGAYNSHFAQAMKVRRKLQSDFDRIFRAANVLHPNQEKGHQDGVDILITPTTTTSAPTLHDVYSTASPIDAYVNDVLTVAPNLAGLPAISLPCQSPGEPPIAVQIVGQFGKDETVLQCARYVSKLCHSSQ